MKDIRERLRQIFRTEHAEHVGKIRAALEGWREAGSAQPGPELDDAFRRAHSLKGAARAVDLPTIGELAHRLESLFSRARHGAVRIDAGGLQTIAQALDLSDAWLERMGEAGDPPGAAAVIAALDALLDPAGAAPAAPPAQPEVPSSGPGNAPDPPTAPAPPQPPAGETPAAPADPRAAREQAMRRKLLAIFQTEHREHVEVLRGLIEGWEQAGGVGPGPDLDEAFRRAHSLKGAARAVDVPAIGELAHRVESLFARVREGAAPLDGRGLEAILRALDASDDVLGAVAAGRPLPDVSTVVQRLQEVLDAAAPPAAGAETLSETPVETAVETPAAPPAEPPAIVSPAAVPEAQPTPAAPPPDLSRSSERAAPEPRAPVPAAGTATPSAETVRVGAEHLDRLLGSAGQLLTESLRQELVTQALQDLSRRVDTMEREWDRVREKSAASLRKLEDVPEFVLVARYVEQIERELSTLSTQARSVRLLQQRSAWGLRHLGEQLQHDVRRARMVPADSTFEGFRKMVRDLARDMGKEVQFRATGLGVEADRMVLQALKDPVMHLLRNALDHGVEPPDEREEAGKERAGRITLRLEARGNRLIVQVEDDGRGLSLDRIREVAVRQGLLSEEEAEAAPRQELVRAIFHPGFSTARAVTDISGRGMGMSVVYETVTRLQGEIDVRPREGGGTVFILAVPLAVSTHKLLLVTSRGQTYAIPTHAIERLHRLPMEEIGSVEGKPVVRVDDRAIPLRGLSHLLGVGGDVSALDGYVPVILLRAGNHSVAIAVDSFVAQIEGLVQDLGPGLDGLARIAGGVILGDGAVALVLNPADLAEAFSHAPSVTTITPATVPEDEGPATIMVVDDSMTTRTLEKSILEAHGYRVRVAVDGLEAITMLQTESVDLVISDLEMPRLDGFGLLEQIKKDPRLTRLPVIMVTSVERREDRERGLSLGADAYIIKRKFDQRELLETIRQIL